MDISLSKKARDKMIWEGASLGEIKECIQKGAKTTKGEIIIAKYGYLTVVFKRRPSVGYHIISLWCGGKEYKAR